MKLDRRIALWAIVVMVSAGGSRLSADPAARPAASESAGAGEVRWIRKTPVAPMPIIAAAPLPSPPAVQAIRPSKVKPLAPAAKVSAKASGKTSESGLPPSEPRVRLAQAEPPATPLDELPFKLGMTLAEAEAIALANNPTLVQAAMRVRMAQGKCLQAGLYPNPTIGYEGDEMGAEGTGGQQGAFFTQEIVTAGKLQLGSAVAAHEIVRAEHGCESQQGRVINDVRAAWYEVMISQQVVELNEQLVRISQEGEDTASKLLDALEVSRVDLLQARVEAYSAQIRLQVARNRYQEAWRRLAALLGTPDMTPTPVAGDLESELPELAWEDSLRRLLAGSPELAEARASVQRARASVQHQHARRVPNVDLRTGVRYHYQAEDTVATVEVGLPLPIFNRNEGNIYRAEAQLVSAEREVRRVELTLRDRSAVVFRQYSNARQEMQKYSTDILPNAKDSLDLVREGYRKGEYDYLTLLTAQRTYFRGNLAYLESLLKYHASRVSIEGFVLTGGLRQPAAAREE